MQIQIQSVPIAQYCPIDTTPIREVMINVGKPNRQYTADKAGNVLEFALSKGKWQLKAVHMPALAACEVLSSRR